jgi:hypothetical protein
MKQITKEIKDYIHHYIGCDVAYHFEGRGKLVGISASEVEKGKVIAIIDIGIVDFQEWYVEECKPILRKLSSMTEVEARDIAVIMFGQPDSVKWRLENKTNYLNVYRKHYHISFTIDLASGDVDIYDEGGIQTTINHHFITKYLLSKGFDLFGLIDAGLAIEKDSGLALDKENK